VYQEDGRARIGLATRVTRFQMPPLPASVGDALVTRGFLAVAGTKQHADVLLKGRAYGYTEAFWRHVGALVSREDGSGWVVGARTPEEQEAVRTRLEAEWVSAGAPPRWARTEADEALESLLVAGRRLPTDDSASAP
jgi:hypothetical protein